MSNCTNQKDFRVKPRSAQTNQTCLGSFVHADGTSSTMADVSGRAQGRYAAARGAHGPTPSGWNLAADAFHRSFTDVIPDTALTATLPDMQGSGMVRDLRQAASLQSVEGAVLASALGQYAASANPQRPTRPGTQPPPPTAAPAPELALAFERAVGVDTHPVLRSHVLDGRAVLPMALHLEWLAHAALHGNPGLVFLGMDNLRITSGVQIEATAAATIKALAGRAVKQDKVFVVPVELRGRRKDGREVIHSRADVLLTASLPKPPAPEPAPLVQPYPHPVDEVYKYFLFHGPDLHGIERVDGLTEVAFIGTAYPAPAPTEWFASPLRSNWVADPLVLDTSFQMLILWSFAQHGAGSLPCFAGRYRQYRRTFPPGPVRVVARVTRDNGTFARADIEYLDADGTVIAQMQDYECVIDAQLNMAFRRNQLAPALARA